MTALVLLPVLAHAQASQISTSTAAQASAPSMLQAKVTPPAALHAAVTAKPAAATPAPAAAAADGSDTMVAVHENIIERNPESDENGGTLSYTILGSDPFVAAKLIKTTPISLSLKDVRTGAFGSTVVVEMTVARDGTPRNLIVTRSGGDALNKRALEAVSQYRFKPATKQGLPIDSTVTVEIKLQQS
jgi:TonB family protein